MSAAPLAEGEILVFGRTGQVAQELARRAPGARFLAREQADLADPEACAAAIRAARPRLVINAAAYTAVDRAESEPETAHAINAAAPGAMARACAGVGAAFVHLSTDYVFDGAGAAPFAPADPTGPLGVYGASKLEGERAVAAAGAPFAVLRTSWVVSAHGANFVKTMLRLSETRDRLTVVADQHGAPTPAGAIAEACLVAGRALLADPGLSGIYHFAGAPDTTWAAFAREIFAQAGRATEVADIPSADYPTPARRPANSRLDCAATEAAFGLPRPDWRAALGGILTELGAKA